MDKKVIGFDLDDTITDIYKDMLNEAYKFDLSINGNGIINNDEYLVGKKYKWSDEILDLFFRKHRIKVVERAKIRDNAIKIMNKLKEDGYKIVIITARSDKYYDDSYQYTYNWLKKNDIPFDKLIVNAKDKREVCLSENIGIFVDDMPQNCEDVLKIPNIKVYLMDNLENTCDNNEIIRVKDYLELYEFIKNGKIN